MALQAGWASLPDSLWTSIVLAAGNTKERMVMAAQLTCVARWMHMSLLGADAAPLWQGAKVRPGYPGYSQRQADGLHRMLAAQGRWIQKLVVVAGGWEADKLVALVGSLPDLASVDLRAKPSSPIAAAFLAALPQQLGTLSIDSIGRAARFPADLQRLTLTFNAV